MFVRRPLSIRFIIEDGGDAGGGEQAPVVDQAPQTSSEQGVQPQGGNPAWDAVRSELDPITFSKIEPHLKGWDAGVQKRIEQASSQFSPFKETLNGRQPEFVGKALAYADALEKDPAQVYQMLGDFLKQTGRLPTAAEAEEQLEQQDDQQEQDDPRVAQLQRQQEQMAAYIAEQQQRQAVEKADAELGQVLTGLQSAHPELTPADVQEIVSRAAFAAQQTPGQNIDFKQSLETAYGQFAELKNRILSTPRPGDSAPHLPPVSGGSPTAPGQQQKPWGQMSSEEVQNFVAGSIAQHRG